MAPTNQMRHDFKMNNRTSTDTLGGGSEARILDSPKNNERGSKSPGLDPKDFARAVL